MSHQSTESKRLSHTLAEWACALKYEHLSPEAIKPPNCSGTTRSGAPSAGPSRRTRSILLEHLREMGGEERTGPCTFVSGFKTNPVDAAFMNAHMMRAMDYNDIYWKADPCHPSDIICRAAGALRESKALRQGPHPRHDHRVRSRDALVRIRRSRHARVRLAPRDADARSRRRSRRGAC